MTDVSSLLSKICHQDAANIGANMAKAEKNFTVTATTHHNELLENNKSLASDVEQTVEKHQEILMTTITEQSRLLSKQLHDHKLRADRFNEETLTTYKEGVTVMASQLILLQWQQQQDSVAQHLKLDGMMKAINTLQTQITCLATSRSLQRMKPFEPPRYRCLIYQEVDETLASYLWERGKRTTRSRGRSPHDTVQIYECPDLDTDYHGLVIWLQQGCMSTLHHSGIMLDIPILEWHTFIHLIRSK
jgi:hypothetical protein